jgi:hypothetical protein
MQEGIKLYKHFTDQVNKMGKIRRAWFTTFNLDISFFEKYILSALMGISYKDLKGPYDYERLNSYLANDQGSLNDETMEVKIFYDYRALIISGRPKQTSVELHPIDIRQLSGLNPDLKFTEGVFHPKVILIETAAGEYWLMVSSANLTFGGWANNRESFFCEKIEGTYVARDIGIFFSGITGSIRGFENNSLLTKLNAGKLGQRNSRWYFISSFNSDRFIDLISPTNDKMSLKVWSPYYADDLNDLIGEIQEEHFDNIEIIPGTNENQKIRITEEVYNKCLEKPGVSFKQDKLPVAAQESFVHAKVWLTPKALAIGSWNMTRSGMNESGKSNNNVEAGVIYNLSAREYETIISDYPTSKLKDPEYLSKDELNQEKETILDPYSLSVDLIADWDKLTITLQNPTYSKLIKQIEETDFIRLPGLGKLKIAALAYEIDFRLYTRILLTDRMFEIENKTSKILYRGYIREIGLDNRPINSFKNIDDYLKGWVLERPEDREELHGLTYYSEEEKSDDLSEQTRKILLSNDQNAWFTSFHAFQCIINRINETKSSYAKDRLAELKRIGRVLPGSLSELRSHLEILLNSYKEDRMNFLKSPVYLWFLIEKANYVFGYFNTEIGLPEEYIKQIKNFEFNDLLTPEQSNEISKENLKKWENYINKELKK